MGKSWEFVLTEVVPYCRTTRASTWTPRYKRYSAWKALVRAIANTASVPSDLARGSRYLVKSVLGWRKGARADLDNAAVKNILDALWAQDRRVMEIQAKAYENCGMDEIRVVVEEL